LLFSTVSQGWAESGLTELYLRARE